MEKSDFQSKDFLKLLGASFMSQTGSHFLTLALSAFIFLKTGSLVQSSLVFVLSYFPSILVGAKLGLWIDRNLSKWIIAGNELISIASTLLCALCIQLHLPIIFLGAILATRAVLIFVSRSASTKWLKLITPPALQTERIKIFNLGFFLSTAISGILAAVVLKFSSIWLIAGLDSLSYILGIWIYLTLSSLPMLNATGQSELTPVASSIRSNGLFETLKIIFSMPGIRISFLIVCLSQSLFQGAYSALVSYLPFHVFKMGMSGVGKFQIAASLGITGGFLLNWGAPKLFAETETVRPLKALSISTFAILSLLACVGASIGAVGIVSFFSLNLAYECVWLHHSAEFFRGSPTNQAARYQFTLSSCAAFLMATATLLYSSAIEFLGPLAGVVSVVVIAFLIVGLGSFLVRTSEESLSVQELHQ